MCIYTWNGYKTWSVFPKVRTCSEGVWEAAPAGNVSTAGEGNDWESEENFIMSNLVISTFHKSDGFPGVTTLLVVVLQLNGGL